MSVQHVPLVFGVNSDGAVERTKFSELLLRYALPLTELSAQRVQSADELAERLELATVCWNAPLLYAEKFSVPDLLSTLGELSEPDHNAVLEMIESRLSGEYQFEAFPFLLHSNVEEGENGRLKCHAYAMYNREPPTVSRSSTPRIGVNERCPCGSGRKYKRCCRTRP